MKYYFGEIDSERCYTLDYFTEQLGDNEEMDIYPAIINYGNGFYYCHEHEVVGEVGEDDCGNECDTYSPRNGKNGRCRHSRSTYSASDEILKIKTVDGKLIKL